MPRTYSNFTLLKVVAHIFLVYFQTQNKFYPVALVLLKCFCICMYCGFL